MPACPHCDAAIGGNGSFCRECGWDVELMIAEARGEGTELPEDLDDDEYARVLAQEGLGAEGAASFPWLPALAVIGLVVLMLLGSVVL